MASAHIWINAELYIAIGCLKYHSLVTELHSIQQANGIQCKQPNQKCSHVWLAHLTWKIYHQDNNMVVDIKIEIRLAIHFYILHVIALLCT